MDGNLRSTLVNTLKFHHSHFLIRAYLCFRMGLSFLIGKPPKVVMGLYPMMGQGYVGFAVPYHKKDYVLFAIPYPQSIMKQFGQKFIELSEDDSVWNKSDEL